MSRAGARPAAPRRTPSLRDARAACWRECGAAWEFDANTIAAALHEHRPTHAFLVPSHLQRLFELDLPASPYRLVTHAGAAISPHLKRRLHQWAGVDSVWEFYGSTEGQFTVCPGIDWEQCPARWGGLWKGRTLEVRDGVIWYLMRRTSRGSSTGTIR